MMNMMGMANGWGMGKGMGKGMAGMAGMAAAGKGGKGGAGVAGVWQPMFMKKGVGKGVMWDLRYSWSSQEGSHTQKLPYASSCFLNLFGFFIFCLILLAVWGGVMCVANGQGNLSCVWGQ